MSLLLTAVFENGFCELYLPGVDNKTVPMDIKPYISGRDEDITLPLEVWNGVWSMDASKQFRTMEREQTVGRVELRPGLLLNCELRDGMVFSLTVDEVTEGNTRFSKYFFNQNAGSRITIGSAANNTICYGNKFTSPHHAEIAWAGGQTVVRDLGSVNGTFVNGRALTGSHTLQYGDVIYIIGLKIVYLGNVLAVNHTTDQCRVSGLRVIEIKPQQTDEPEQAVDSQEEAYFLRTPRKLEQLDREVFTIEKCPSRQKQKRQPLLFTIGPSFPMVIPMAIGAMMTMGQGGFGAAGLVMSVGAAVMGTVWALLNAGYQKKEEKRTETARVENYTAYIARLAEQIGKKLQYNREVLERRYPSAQQSAEFARTGSHRLWEKSSTHADFLDIRLGVGDIPSLNEIVIAKEQAMAEHDPLNDKVDEIRIGMSVLHQVPVALSLDENRFVGIVSTERERCLNLARVMLIQLTAAHPYTDVRLCCVFPAKEAEHWNFTHYLPHAWTTDGKLRMLCCDSSTVGNVMYELSGIIRDRLEKRKSETTRKAACFRIRWF